MNSYSSKTHELKYLTRLTAIHAVQPEVANNQLNTPHFQMRIQIWQFVELKKKEVINRQQQTPCLKITKL